MKYGESLPENRPVPITRKLIEELGFECVVEGTGPSGIGIVAVYVIVSREPGGMFKKDLVEYCAMIDITHLHVYIYGDAYKQAMIEMAQELEKRLLVVPKQFIHSGTLCADFRSHDTVSQRMGK